MGSNRSKAMTNRQRIKYWKRILWHLDQAEDIFATAVFDASDKDASEFCDIDFLGTTLGSAQDDAHQQLEEAEAKLDSEAKL